MKVTLRRLGACKIDIALYSNDTPHSMGGMSWRKSCCLSTNHSHAEDRSKAHRKSRHTSHELLSSGTERTKRKQAEFTRNTAGKNCLSIEDRSRHDADKRTAGDYVKPLLDIVEIFNRLEYHC